MDEPTPAEDAAEVGTPGTTTVPAPGGGGWTSWPAGARRWVLGGVFVGGLVVGMLATGVLADSSPVYAGEPSAAAGDDRSGAGGLDEVDPNAAQALVNQPCLRALNVAQDTLAAGAALGEAASVLDPAQLDEAVRRLQPLQSRLDVDLAACRVVEVEAPALGGSSPSGTGGPAAGEPEAPESGSATPTG